MITTIILYNLYRNNIIKITIKNMDQTLLKGLVKMSGSVFELE